jgi:hypothetical protein
MVEPGTIGFGVVLLFVLGYAVYHFVIKKDKDVTNTGGVGGSDGSLKKKH